MSKSNKSKNEISLGTAITLVVIIAVIIVAIIIITTKIANKGNDEIGETNTLQIAEADKTENKDVDERKEVVEEHVSKQEDGQKVNISEKFKETRKFEGLTLENIQLTSQNSQTHLIATVKNETSKDIDAIKVNIILLDKDGKEIVELGGEIGATKAGKTTQLDIGSSLDYANAYDFKIEKGK